MYASMNPSPSYNLTIRRPSLRPQRPFSSSLSRSVQLHRPGPSTHSQNYKRSHTQKYYAYIVTAAPLAKKKRARCPDKHTKSFPKKSTESRGPINVPKTCRDLKSSYLIVSKLGEGAFGKVYISEDRISGERCVVKMIKSSYKEEQDSGFSICALREINLLKSMCYESIVLLKDVVTHTGRHTQPEMTCMVFEYLEYDLSAIIRLPEIADNLSEDHVKSWLQQLLSACHYLHTNNILHRDLKPSNILVSRNGVLKIADFGLARRYNPLTDRQLTYMIVTLWYRVPELLLGCTAYDNKIDMWSVGCVIAELYQRCPPLFQGANEKKQLQKIFEKCGRPTKDNWPDIEHTCPLWRKVQQSSIHSCQKVAPWPVWKNDKPHNSMTSNSTENMISNLLQLNPKLRWSANDALVSEYFSEAPVAKSAHKLSMPFSVSSAHDMDMHKISQARDECERRCKIAQAVARKERKVQTTITGWMQPKIAVHPYYELIKI